MTSPTTIYRGVFLDGKLVTEIKKSETLKLRAATALKPEGTKHGR